jgi:hypothetical protein
MQTDIIFPPSALKISEEGKASGNASRRQAINWPIPAVSGELLPFDHTQAKRTSAFSKGLLHDGMLGGFDIFQPPKEFAHK